jgi:hypothetical protein
MRKGLMFVFISLFILMTGCSQQALMKTKNVQNATQNMAKNEWFQKSFSDGRIHVMENVLETKRSILQNTVREQKMMMEDPNLSSQYLALNINMNQMMSDSPSGKEQLMRSTLMVMDGITKDANKLRSFVQIQNESRKNAMKEEKLLNQILLQNMQEQYLALNHPATSGDMKHLSLKTTNAILNDKVLKSTMLKQNIQAFSDISASPSLRSNMADAMIPLLKDPKIAKELENMIKLAVAEETQKLQVKIKQLQKMKQPENSAEEDKKQPNNNSNKINPSMKDPVDDKQKSQTRSQRPDPVGVDR